MSIHVEISPGRMEALVDVRRGSEPLTVDAIKRALDEAGVCHGIDEDACGKLVEAIDQVPEGGRIQHRVAQGTPPANGADGGVRMLMESHRSSVGVENQSGIVDFHERGAFTSIEQEQLIAEIVLPGEGTPGKDVCGEELKPEPGKKASITAGQGTTLTAGGTELRATRAGDLRCSGDRIEVSDSIRIPGDLGYEMGSVECEGSVRVEGDVLPGFHIRAGGEVTVGGVVDGAEVGSGHTVVVRQGVIRGGRVSAEEALTVGYVSAAYLQSETSVKILKEAVHGTVVSGGSITMPATGRVIGGSLSAHREIEIGSAGHVKGTLTVLAAGVDPLRDLRAAKLAAKMQSSEGLRRKLERIKDFADEEGKGRLEPLLDRQAAKHEETSAELEDLEREDGNLLDCRIKVHKDVHSGVLIRIGRSEMKIEEPVRRATFRYDSESGIVGLFDATGTTGGEE